MTEPLTLITLLDLPADQADAVVARWPAGTAPLAEAPGFQGSQLYRTVPPESRYQIISLTHWDGLEPAQAALSGPASQEDSLNRTAQAALYRTIFDRPDPVAAGGDAPAPFTLINVLSMPADMVDAFFERWLAVTAPVLQAAGFRGTRLHRAVSTDTAQQVINVAHWDSVEQSQAAMSAIQPQGAPPQPPAAGGVQSERAFYRSVGAMAAPRVAPSLS